MVNFNPSEVMTQKAQRNAELREKLITQLSRSRSSVFLSQPLQPSIESDKPSLSPNLSADILLTYEEVVERHGTGMLLKRIFSNDQNILSIRSCNQYDGTQTFGRASICLSLEGYSRPEIYESVIKLLKDCQVRRVFCVPYTSAQLLTALAIKDSFDVPLGIWIIGDSSIALESIPERLMRECLEKSALRLATHLELCAAYEAKYGLKFWALPVDPLVATERNAAEWIWHSMALGHAEDDRFETLFCR